MYLVVQFYDSSLGITQKGLYSQIVKITIDGIFFIKIAQQISVIFTARVPNQSTQSTGGPYFMKQVISMYVCK